MRDWHNEAHIDRRAKLADDLLTGAKQMGTTECEHCDPDVGYVCECCFSAQAMREAASYLRAMNQAAVADTVPRARRESPKAVKEDPRIAKSVKYIKKANPWCDRCGDMKELLAILTGRAAKQD